MAILDSFVNIVKIRIFDHDVFCNGCGIKIKAGCMVLYLQNHPECKKNFCLKKECGGEQLRIFVLDIDSPSFT